MNNQLDLLASQTSQLFYSRFGSKPNWIAAAPGRVNLIGEHVDYNQGLVLPMAIGRYTLVAASPAGHSNTLSVVSVQQNGSCEIDLRQPLLPGQPAWGNYIRGVVAGFIDRGLEIPGLQLLVHSSVPLGSGLSSSAALEVATATVLEAALQTTLAGTEKALLCQRAEHQFVGVPCGIMDQFASVFAQSGKLMLLDCRQQQFEMIPFDDHHLAVLVIDSNVRHELADGQYARRREQCELAAKKLDVRSLRDVSMNQLQSQRDQLTADEYARARHVVSEIQRVEEFVAALQRQDWPAAGQLLYASHQSLRNDYQVSCRELDELVASAEKIGPAGGVFGSRMTGGGFGGCTVSLVSRESAQLVAETILRFYQQTIGREATAFVSRPSRGGHLVKSR